MRKLITILLTALASFAWAQELPTPPAGSQGASAVKSGIEYLLGRTGGWSFVARKAYVDSLQSIGYTKVQVDSAINASNALTASNGLQISSGNITPVYGTGANTVAQGNDSRINNGQTAFGWGDYRQFGIGGIAPRPADLNDVFTGGLSYSSTTSVNRPYDLANVITIAAAADAAAQLSIPLVGNYLAYRNKAVGLPWSAWKTVWDSGNFNPSNYILASQKGVANGVASLDGSGKVPVVQLPTTGMQYQGTWDASTNSPTLANGTGTDGHFYRVTTAGTQNLGSGNITFSVGDDVIHNGSVWQRAPSGSAATYTPDPSLPDPPTKTYLNTNYPDAKPGDVVYWEGTTQVVEAKCYAVGEWNYTTKNRAQ